MRLSPEIYNLGAEELAPFLLGKQICRKIGSETLRLRITETECYRGEDDTACHAHRGKTPRNSIMYGSGGKAYVYLCYGIHHLLNVICGKEGSPEGVLIRGAGTFAGPARLTKALSVDMSFCGEDLTESERLWFEDDGFQVSRDSIMLLKRVGIDYAAEADINRLWRYKIII